MGNHQWRPSFGEAREWALDTWPIWFPLALPLFHTVLVTSLNIILTTVKLNFVKLQLACTFVSAKNTRMVLKLGMVQKGCCVVQLKNMRILSA